MKFTYTCFARLVNHTLFRKTVGKVGKQRLVAVAAAIISMGISSCGGGATETSSAAAPPIQYPPAIAGDPPFTSNCNETPTVSTIGPFATQAGDCFVSYKISDAEWAALARDFTTAPIQKKLMTDLAENFKNRIDVVMTLVDSDTYVGVNGGANYTIKNCNIHNTSCTRFARLGNIWLGKRDLIKSGPRSMRFFMDITCG